MLELLQSHALNIHLVLRFDLTGVVVGCGADAQRPRQNSPILHYGPGFILDRQQQTLDDGAYLKEAGRICDDQGQSQLSMIREVQSAQSTFHRSSQAHNVLITSSYIKGLC